MYSSILSFFSRLSQAQIVSLIILAFIVWSLISWQWYVCGIRGLCGETLDTPDAVFAVPTAEASPTAPTDLCLPLITTPLGLSEKSATEEARRLASFLNTHYHARLALDGIFGPSDHAAVTAFQRTHNLPTTGEIDETTREVINREACSLVTTN
jgi:peptidoglycan hydrolase-like protein with peptidoglycan-binding domain